MASHHFTNLLLKSSTKIARVIGNSLLYGSIFALITGSLVYAATGTKLMSNFLSSGVDFISFFSGAADGNIGIDAKSFYARTNGSWLGYPADNKNYLRNDTFMSGALYDENNSAYYVNPNGTSQFNTMSGKTICLNGACKTGWNSIIASNVSFNATNCFSNQWCTILGWNNVSWVKGNNTFGWDYTVYFQNPLSNTGYTVVATASIDPSYDTNSDNFSDWWNLAVEVWQKTLTWVRIKHYPWQYAWYYRYYNLIVIP